MLLRGPAAGGDCLQATALPGTICLKRTMRLRGEIGATRWRAGLKIGSRASRTQRSPRYSIAPTAKEAAQRAHDAGLGRWGESRNSP